MLAILHKDTKKLNQDRYPLCLKQVLLSVKSRRNRYSYSQIPLL